MVKPGFTVGRFGAGVHSSDLDAASGATFRVDGGSSRTSASGDTRFDFARDFETIAITVRFTVPSAVAADRALDALVRARG